jgi:hypothetical protein
MARPADVFALVRAGAGRHVKKRILFVHVPKCGGEAIHAAIRNAYGPLAVAQRGRMVRINPGASERAARALGRPVGAFREELLAYHMENPATRYLAGHVTVSDQLLDAVGDGWHLVTVLREPVSKWLSAYFYDRYKTHEHRRHDLSLPEFLESERGRQLGSEYVWRFAPQYRGDASRSEEAIAAASATLSRFAVAGVLERLDLFSSAFEQAFAVPLRIGHTNQSPASQARRDSEVTADITALVRTICEPNIRIYDEVKRRALES